MTPDGSIVGSLPTPILTSEKVAHSIGIGSVLDHAAIRLTDGASPTSTNFNYILFLFEVCLNIQATFMDTRIMMTKGVSETIENISRLGRCRVSGSIMQFDRNDARNYTDKLGSTFRYKSPVYFGTITCTTASLLFI